MRSKKILLQIVLDNLDDMFNNRNCWGLCSLSNKLSSDGTITEEEWRTLNVLWDQLTDYDDLGFKWEPAEIEPRRKWLEEQLKNA